MAANIWKGRQRISPSADFSARLDSWVDSVTGVEINSRIDAKNRLIKAKESGARSLSFAGLYLSSIPDELEELTNLSVLDLSNNWLGTPHEETSNLAILGKITNLQQLDLSNNALTKIPAGIGNLAKMQILNLSNNEITIIDPAEIRELNEIRTLDLFQNKLTDFPRECLIPLDEDEESNDNPNTDHNNYCTIFYIPEKRQINLKNNKIGTFNAQSLSSVASLKMVDLEVKLLNYEELETPEKEALVDAIADEILIHSPSEERKKELKEFLQSDGLDNFKHFLSRCHYATNWVTNNDQMTECLFRAVDRMSRDEEIKIKFEEFAASAFEGNNRRIELAFVKMQFHLDIPAKEIDQMNEEEFYDYAKQETIIKFLSDSAEKYSVEHNHDDFSKYLTLTRYLHSAPALGLELKDAGLTQPLTLQQDSYQKRTNRLKESFFTSDENRVAAHIYESDTLRQHPLVKEVIEQTTNKRTEEGSANAEEFQTLRLEFTSNIQKAFRDRGITTLEFTPTSPGETIAKPSASTAKQEVHSDLRRKESISSLQ